MLFFLSNFCYQEIKKSVDAAHSNWTKSNKHAVICISTKNLTKNDENQKFFVP